MKKKTIAILMALMLLGGCSVQTPTPADVPPAGSQDLEAVIQQSVDEALQEKLKEYEEEQQKKDQEIAELKKQLEELTTPPEVPPEPAEEETPSAPVSQPEETPSQPETPSMGVPPQPEPEPAPAPSSASSYDPYNLRNLYPGFVWENTQPSEDGSEGGGEPEESTGSFREDDALEVIRLTNLERENHGLDPLPIDEDLMELARIRAMEIREKYSHTRPDGTSVVDLRCGENCGQNSSAKKQVEAWMNSEGHRTNILLDRYHHIGVGCYQAPNGNLYWVQVFSLD